MIDNRTVTECIWEKAESYDMECKKEVKLKTDRKVKAVGPRQTP